MLLLMLLVRSRSLFLSRDPDKYPRPREITEKVCFVRRHSNAKSFAISTRDTELFDFALIVCGLWGLYITDAVLKIQSRFNS